MFLSWQLVTTASVQDETSSEVSGCSLKWQNVFQKLKSKKHAINHEANTYFRNFLQITKRTSRGINSITARCCFSIPPENIRKPLVSGGIEKQHQAVMD